MLNTVNVSGGKELKQSAIIDSSLTLSPTPFKACVVLKSACRYTTQACISKSIVANVLSNLYSWNHTVAMQVFLKTIVRTSEVTMVGTYIMRTIVKRHRLFLVVLDLVFITKKQQTTQESLKHFKI